MSFDNDPTAGTTLVLGSIHSPNYAQGAAGWTINKDGSAEFQNVLVRGTITASTIIGSTIIGGTVVGGDFQSANFSNTAMTGFDLNGNATTDTAGTPGNTIQVYSNFNVGPAGGNQIQLFYNGTESAVDFFTGNPADSVSAAIVSNTFVQSGSGRTISSINFASATENGAVELQLNPSGGTTAADFPGQALFFSVSETAPTGWNGVKGRLFLGANGTTDVWEICLTNENSVVSSGTTLGNPALILGDLYTPRSRLLVSVSELLTVNGSNVPATLYLNENNTESLVGGLQNARHRSSFAFSGGSAGANIAATAYANLPAPQTTTVTLVCPPSGVLAISFSAQAAQNAAAVLGDFVAFAVNVVNNTQVTTPFAASDNRCATWTTIVAGAAGYSATLSRTLLVTGVGNAGDSLTVNLQGRVSVANHFFVERTDLVVTPNL